MFVGPTELLIIVGVIVLLFGPVLGVLAWVAFTLKRVGEDAPAPRAARTLEGASESTSAPDPTDPAVAIARERFAAGEITSEELDEILGALGE